MAYLNETGLARLWTHIISKLGEKMNKANPLGTGSFSMNIPEGITPGAYSTSLGLLNEATGDYSFAYGVQNKAPGAMSFAHGIQNEAVEDYASAQGYKTIAYEGQFTNGRLNIPDPEKKYEYILGNGDFATNARSNSHTIDWDGNAWFSGDVYVGGTSQEDTNAVKLATNNDIPEAITSAELAEICGTFAILNQPKSARVSLGEIVYFIVEAEGDNLTYQWQYNDGYNGWKNNTTGGHNTPILTITAETHRNNYQYHCIINDSNGNTLTTNPATLTIVNIKMISQPTPVTAMANEQVAFEVVAEGDGLTYQWEFTWDNGTHWENSTRSSATSPKLMMDAQTWHNGYLFRCKITNSAEEVWNSNSAKLTISSVVITQQPVSQILAVGETATFSVTATNVSTYQWQVLGASGHWQNLAWTGYNTATMTREMNMNNIQYKYRCKLTGTDGTIVYTDVINFGAIAITKQPEDAVAGVNGIPTFTVEALGEGLIYQWQYKISTMTNFENTSHPGYNTNTLTPTATPGRNGMQYRCVITDASGNTVTSDPATLYVVPIVITEQPENMAGAVGSWASFNVEAQGQGLTYQWQLKTPNGTTWTDSLATGNTTDNVKFEIQSHHEGYQYRCVITDVNGNTVTSATAVIYISDIVIATQPQSLATSIGDTATFSVDASGSISMYRWEQSTDGGKTWNKVYWGNSGFDTNTFTFTVTNTSRHTALYRCCIYSSVGDNYNVFTDEVSVSPVITKQPKDTTAIVATEVTFGINAKGSGLTYQWQYCAPNTTDWVNSSAYGATTATVKFTPNANMASGHKYRCIVTDTKGNTATSNIITLTLVPVLAITKQPESVTATVGDTVTFSVEAEGGGLTYQWQWLGDGNTSWRNTTVTGNQTSAITVEATTGRNGYQYRCLITDMFSNQVLSNAVTLTVNS